MMRSLFSFSSPWTSLSSNAGRLVVLALALFSAGTLLSESALAEKKPGATLEVESVIDVPYYEGADADKIKHKLDLFLPKGVNDYPVLFFVHGGAWRHGDKSFLGMYSNFGRFWAQRGIGTVVTNYRLSPGVKHPEHMRDVARAFAWTYRNISKYRGNPNEMFVAGHSAGGHLVSLLSTDEKYLKNEGLALQTIKGAIPMSGIYHIPEESKLFEPMFGAEAMLRKDASPIAHVHPDAPPFLIIYADNDLPYCGKPTSEDFCRALKDKHCAAQTLEVKERNHITVFLGACTAGDPAMNSLQQFLDSRTTGDKSTSGGAKSQ